MKKLLAVAFCLVLGVGAGVAQKQRYSESHKPDVLDYPLLMHVTGARLLKMPAPVTVHNGDTPVGTGEPISILHLIVILDGLKIELETGASALLHRGEYRARVVAQDEKKSGWFTRTYDVLFTDGTHVVFTQVAEGE